MERLKAQSVVIQFMSIPANFRIQKQASNDRTQSDSSSLKKQSFSRNIQFTPLHRKRIDSPPYFARPDRGNLGQCFVQKCFPFEWKAPQKSSGGNCLFSDMPNDPRPCSTASRCTNPWRWKSRIQVSIESANRMSVGTV
jgi:hypothetical protein